MELVLAGELGFVGGMRGFLVWFIVVMSVSAEVIFDGKSLKGWEVRKGEEKYWRVEHGAIVGGSLKERVPHNTFLSFKKRIGDFELRLKVKVVGKNPNAGVQVRSERVKNHHEMIGYQADIGPGLWGRLYDESRRRRFIGDWISKEAKKASKKGWNDYRIRCEGKRVRIWVNGVLTCDYTEKEKGIPGKGLIALQAHSGPPFEVWYREIVLEKLGG